MSETKIKCFVGHVYSREQIDDLRRAIWSAFEEYTQFTPWFADDYYTPGHIFSKIQDGIDKALFCIFELSHQSKPNVFLELGYALGKGKTCLLIVKAKTDLPSDLAGLDRIEYASMTQLSDGLKKFLPQIIQEAVNRSRPVGRLNGRVIAVMPPPASSSAPIDVSSLIDKVTSIGLAEKEVFEKLKELHDLGYIEQHEQEWIVSETGASDIPKLIEFARKNIG